MKKYKNMLAALLLTGAMLSLAACSHNGSAASSGNTEPPASADVQPSAPASTVPSDTAPESDSGGGAPSEPAQSSAADAAAVQQVKDLLELAKDGRVPGIPFAAHTSLIDDVNKAWGEADKQESAGKGMYATYSDKHAVFGFNKGSQIFDVRSSSSDLQGLTLQDIKAALGDPAGTTKNGDDQIYIYNANKQYQLKFIIPSSTGKVDHISVFSPEDSVNNMAG